MATKEHRRRARGLIEGLESRVHAGPPIGPNEIVSAREFLRVSEFSPASDYFSRLTQLQDRLATRAKEPPLPPAKRNYGGEAGETWMQLQSAYDHVILSTCYQGDFNLKHGRIKISHRFNQAGRIDFVELKFLASLQPLLNGAYRKLVTVKDFSVLRKDWSEAEAFVLEVLPRELVFLYDSIFRCPKSELFAWLINIGHRLMDDLFRDLRQRPYNGSLSEPDQHPKQLPLESIRADTVAFPIIEKAAPLECITELLDPKTIVIRYHTGPTRL